uniref:Uncharacterized protein n=1 Tax=Anguilla anguilla TaxID=7936 RepID=A0A0E9PXT3_ANGAN
MKKTVLTKSCLIFNFNHFTELSLSLFWLCF